MKEERRRANDSLLSRWVVQFFNPIYFAKAFSGYRGFFSDWSRYSRMHGSEPINLRDTIPSVHDRTPTTPFDAHYFYQGVWAFKKVCASKPALHVDVGSQVDLVGFLTAVTKVTFIDIRPLEADLENFDSKKGSILSLPFEDDSLESLSCLHVAEHIGLGRYGDVLDPHGTAKACKELSRVLGSGGNLYFSVPVGKPKLCFNSHRIHSPKQILDYFEALALADFSGVDDSGQYRKSADPEDFKDQEYACGLFHFTKTS